MMTIRMLMAAALMAAFVVPWSSAARAAEPTLSDIAGCNEEAAARTSGATLPRPTTPAPGTNPTPGTSPAPIVQGERDLPRQAGKEKTDPTGSIVTDSADPLVKGMDAQRANDPAYRTAYRECMRTHTKTER